VVYSWGELLVLFIGVVCGVCWCELLCVIVEVWCMVGLDLEVDGGL